MERADGPPIRRIRFYNLEVVLGAVDEKTHRLDVHTNCVGEAPERRLFDGKSRYFGVDCGVFGRDEFIGGCWWSIWACREVGEDRKIQFGTFLAELSGNISADWRRIGRGCC